MINLLRGTDDPSFVLEELSTQINTDCNKTKPNKLVRKPKPHILILVVSFSKKFHTIKCCLLKEDPITRLQLILIEH